MKNAYSHVQDTLVKEYKKAETSDYDYNQIRKDRQVLWRREKESIVLVEKPMNLARARSLGYKAKEGISVARIRIRKGKGVHPLPRSGRKPKKMGRVRLTRVKSIQAIAEQRVAQKYRDLEVLNSYWVGEDGQNKYFEVILVDPYHPAILADKELNWIVGAQHTGRVFRGKTSAQRKSRGLMYKGKGVEKVRPSLRANKRLAR